MSQSTPGTTDFSAPHRGPLEKAVTATAGRASFEIAHSVRHTGGQSLVMAFQAGGPHAQDRGLEAVAYAWAERRRCPGAARWTKPLRKGDPLAMDRTFTPVGRGVAPPAITVRTAREVIAEAGFDRNVVILAAEPQDQHTAPRPAAHPAEGDSHA